MAKEIRESSTPSGDDELKRAYFMLNTEAERVSKVMLDAHMLSDEQSAVSPVEIFRNNM